jgi:hypothetical protein
MAFVWALVGVTQAQSTYVLLTEDFEGLPLGPNVDEGLAGTAVWTDTPPAGWTVDRSGVPGIGDRATDGVTEWAGWGFAEKDWWVQTAADQRRSEFTLGKGTVAIADPDEWDDAGHPAASVAGWYRTFMSTAPIDLSSARPGTVKLQFDSSWRPEYDDNYHQTGNLTVSFDGAAPIELFRWESDSASPNFKNDNSTNETIVVNVPNPAGATSMVLTFGLFDAGNDWWWAIDNVVVTGKWSGARASNPNPSNGAEEVGVKSLLSWTPGEYVGGSSPKHRVLLSNDLNKVNDETAVVSTQDANSYDATGRLGFSTKYYWRIDEANSVTGWNVGNVWSFTSEAFAYPITGVSATASSSAAGMGPEKTIDGSGLTGDLHGAEGTTMWLSTGAQPNWIQYQFDKVYKLNDLKVWNSNQLIESFLGFGAKSVTIETSTDGTTWTALANMPEFAKAPGVAGYAANTTVSLGGVMAKYVKLTINSTWGGMGVTGLSEVRFSYVPVQASAPQPANAATGVKVDTALTWKSGREAASHKVYFGADLAAVANGTGAAQTVADHSYVPSSLTFGTTYYWRVDEVNTVTYPGNVWSFTTQQYKPVDDFESYNDDDNRIYDAWIDGYTDGKSGSIVGNMTAPFAEQTILHGGKQAMPFEYNNVKAPYYSEASRTFDVTQNWTTNGADTLSLYFRGRAAGFADNGNGTFTMSSSGTDVWNNGDQFRFAYKSLNGDGSIVARVDSIANTNVWAKGGVMIRQSIDPGSTHAFMPITAGGSGAGNGASFQRRLTAAGASTNDDNAAPAVAAPYWVKVERKGNSFTGSISADGKTWKQLGTAQTITMTNPVLIGLAVTSHDAALTTTAEISNVSTTGTVTGSWQAVAIGMAMPTNGAAPLYLTVTDKAGKSKTVVNPNPSASATAAWTQWRIPLSDLTGVSLTTVQKITLGVGDKASPKAGAAGMLYFDDVGFGRSGQ